VLGLNSPSKSIILSLSLSLCIVILLHTFHGFYAVVVVLRRDQHIIILLQAISTKPTTTSLSTLTYLNLTHTSDTTLTPATNERTNNKSIGIITMRTTKQAIILNLEKNQSSVVRTSGGAAITVILAGTLIIPLSLHFLNAPTNRCAIHDATVRHNTPTTPSTTKP
jgi:hypothetical protein